MMTFNDLYQGLDKKKLLAANDAVYGAILRIKGIAPLSKATPFPYTVSERGIFVCVGISARYSTLMAGPVDDGVCRMSLDWSNTNGRIYIEKPLTFDMFSSPGRVKSPGVAGSDSNQKNFNYLDFIAVLSPKDNLTFNITNDGTADNSFEIGLHGAWVIK